MKSKYLILGDIHGRTFWKDIISKENPDMTVFLGDYFTTHEGYSSEEIATNFVDILNYKEANPLKVKLLRGNHDLQVLYKWASCTPTPGSEELAIADKEKDRFLKLSQWIYMFPREKTGLSKDIVCSHAGISKKWMENCGFSSIHFINEFPPSKSFGFIEPDYSGYGDDPNQSLTWIRPQSLVISAYRPDQYIQIVGHTLVPSPVHYKGEKPTSDLELDLSETDIWFNDCLGNEWYLVIEDGVITPKEL